MNLCFTACNLKSSNVLEYRQFIYIDDLLPYVRAVFLMNYNSQVHSSVSFFTTLLDFSRETKSQRVSTMDPINYAFPGGAGLDWPVSPLNSCSSQISLLFCGQKLQIARACMAVITDCSSGAAGIVETSEVQGRMKTANKWTLIVAAL